ncbi:probable beta-1,3 exoglucanase precursor [Cephalotrichum gorgonifer]|uniref:Probable beta-1,3 exoglucanase n=1 Tax=Cephalotrichum gorgonifer TaxID=2041049 RepID=A0AAE8MV19_9PEZI|nr:probable beta-1,3 exoglucanase precursor [Cephalotrichum gorgonifer]
MGFKALVTRLLALGLLVSPTLSSPSPQASAAPAAGTYWLADIERQGQPAFGVPGYQVFRNVKEFGAVGDGVADDTKAINDAVTLGSRCGQGCDSSTVTPAIVYFPPGTYRVTAPIIPYYYTQLIGDAVDRPILKADPAFIGMAVIDANPYDNSGNNWFTNQNNFFRQVRNFVIDVTEQPLERGTGIHWQVAQATSLQNIEFNMREDKSEANRQQGLYIENGSGGFMSDLVFNGGKFGAWIGSQQFTSRNMKFKNCQTAVFLGWNWLWSFHELQIDNCGVGIDMTNVDGPALTVGSALVLDSKFSNTPVGISTLYNPESTTTNNTLILDNVDMTQNVPVAVSNKATNATLLAGNVKVDSWAQGRVYNGADGGKAVQDTQTPVTKPAGLLDKSGKVVTRSKPQYEDVPASQFVSVKKNGAVGDGATDDSDAIQKIFDAAKPGEIVYFDHGAYLVTKTINVPKDIKITGEIWPMIMAGGDSAFKDEANPQPVFRVGKPGDVGVVEISELTFETKGPQPGAILMEWNVAGTKPGDAGLWDVHFRVGGTAGTGLQSDKCKKTPEVKTDPNPECVGSFMLLHVTPEGSGYFENTWLWVSDHELDRPDFSQINIYNGRGILIESTKGVWLWGTASEHNVLYNYQISSAANVYLSLIQTETAYFQGNPGATVPFAVNKAFKDPDFKAFCSGGSSTCARTWGVRVLGSKDVFIYGAGIYSFFDNYEQECVAGQNCQDHIVSIEDSDVHLFGLSTKASVNMVTLNGDGVATDADNRSTFCGTIAIFHASA